MLNTLYYPYDFPRYNHFPENVWVVYGRLYFGAGDKE